MIFPAVIVDGYKANGVVFDGANDYLSRGSMTGATASRYCTMALWLKMTTGTDGTDQYLFNIFDAFTQLFIYRNAANELAIDSRGAAGLNLQLAKSTDTITVSDGWVHILAKWDTVGNTAQIYLDDVSGSTVTAFNSANGEFDGGSVTIATGAFNPGVSFYAYEMAEFWLAPGVNLDLSVAANRRLFTTGGGRPKSLGPDGSRPTGTAPLVYLKGPAASFNTNLGTGGNFSVTGSLTNSTTSPP